MKNPTRIESSTPENRNTYDSPQLTVIGNATELVQAVSDFDGSDYFGFARSEFEFEPDGDDAETS